MKIKHTVETVIVVALKKIGLDFANTRFSVDIVRATGEIADSGGTIDELMADMRVNGQETPVLVRPHPDRGKRGAPEYQLICGFRRFTAISRLAEAGEMVPQIKVIVREMTDADAFIANARENTGRNNLTAPDLAFSILRIESSWEQERGTSPSDRELAETLHKSTGWINKLRTIVKTLSPAAIELWRKYDVKIPLLMPITAKAKEAQAPAILRAIGRNADGSPIATDDTTEPENPADALKGGGKSGWIKSAAKEAQAAGIMFARMANCGALVVPEKWPSNLPTIVSPKYAEQATKDLKTIKIPEQHAKFVAQAHTECLNAFNAAFARNILQSNARVSSGGNVVQLRPKASEPAKAASEPAKAASEPDKAPKASKAAPKAKAKGPSVASTARRTAKRGKASGR